MPISFASLSGGSSSGADTGFDLVIGTSGNTTFQLADFQAAGEYTITSTLNDTTYDIYFINEDNENVGYTTGGKITATEPFKKVVVYGGNNNDILKFKFGFVSEPTGNGNINGGAAPFITSISPTNLPNNNDTMTITGGNFATNVQVILIGTNNVEYAPKTTVRSSSTQIVVTRPDGLLVSNGPYDVKVINPGITPAAQKPNQLTNTMFVGSGLTWTTAATLPPFTPGTAYTTTVVASDPDASAITYSITAGSLPTGLSLNSSTGVISGTSNDTTTSTPTIRATDAGGNTADRQFSISPTVSASGGTTVTSGGYRYHTFTSSGTFTVSRGGAVEIVTVAGGGSGRITSDSYKAGGGAGGFLISSTSLSSGSYNLVVGGAGSNTTFGSLTALTAIAGGSGADSTGGGNSGGSGGGNTYGPGGSGTANQGNSGGTTGADAWNSGVYAGGGGGGRDGGGGGGYRDGNQNIRGGGGGGGINYTTWGAATSTGELSGGQRYYAGGGGGAPGPVNGIGHGANTGGGGAGGSGGDSGLIMIRYAI
jgi:hypothetical protein